MEHKGNGKIRKNKKKKETVELRNQYRRGDSVMVFPDKKIGIVCKPVNEKGSAPGAASNQKNLD